MVASFQADKETWTALYNSRNDIYFKVEIYLHSIYILKYYQRKFIKWFSLL